MHIITHFNLMSSSDESDKDEDATHRSHALLSTFVGGVENNTPFMAASALQSSSRNCSQVPDLMLWKLISPQVPFFVLGEQSIVISD